MRVSNHQRDTAHRTGTATENTNGGTDTHRRGRRTFLRGVGTVALTAALPSVASAAGGTTEPTANWIFETNGGVSSSPTVVRNTVYVGSADGNLWAIHTSNGIERFHSDVGTPIYDAPTVTGNWLFFASEELSINTREAGDPVWTYSHPYIDLSMQTVAGDRVFLSSGADIVAVDHRTREQVWEFTDAFGATTSSSPAVADGTVFAGLGAASLFAIDAATGTQQWRFETEPTGNVNASPTVVDGVVYVGSDDGNLYAVDTDSGTELWRRELGAGISSSPTVYDGRVYVGAMMGGFDGAVFALDGRTGDVVWERPIPDETVDRTSPTIADDVVYVGSDGFDSHLHAIDARTGEIIWQYETDGWIHSSPTVVDGVVYVGDQSGSVYAIDAVGSGSSEDSRVDGGVLGHHHTWEETSSTIEFEEMPSGQPDESGDDDETGDDADDGAIDDDPATGDDTDDQTSATAATADGDDTVPGPGVLGTAAAVGGVGYLLGRRHDFTTSE